MQCSEGAVKPLLVCGAARASAAAPGKEPHPQRLVSMLTNLKHWNFNMDFDFSLHRLRRFDLIYVGTGVVVGVPNGGTTACFQGRDRVGSVCVGGCAAMLPAGALCASFVSQTPLA